MIYFNKVKVSFVRRLLFMVSLISILMVLLTLSACDKDLDIKTSFPFELEVMPVPKSIAKGETVTIRCAIKTEAKYDGTKYYIRYFQFDGSGKLSVSNGKKLKPNNSYKLPDEIFRLYYVSESNVTQSFDVWISNNSGHEQKVTFQFNSKDK